MRKNSITALYILLYFLVANYYKKISQNVENTKKIKKAQFEKEEILFGKFAENDRNKGLLIFVF
jgi:hypothetical protein